MRPAMSSFLCCVLAVALVGQLDAAPSARPVGSRTEPCGNVGRVAALLIGYVSTSDSRMRLLDRALTALAENVVGHLGADVHAVYQAQKACAPSAPSDACARAQQQHEALLEGALSRRLQPRLRSVGVVLDPSWTAERLRALGPSAAASGVHHERILELLYKGEAFKAFDARYATGTTRQWFKLREAWRLMQAHEAREGAAYDVVIKLRMDAVPLPRWCLCPARDALRPGDPPVVHALTDIVFWGRRDAMQIAADLFDNLAYFERAEYAPPPAAARVGPDGVARAPAAPPGPPTRRRGRPALGSRPVAVTPTLVAVRSLPARAFSDWTLYQKIGHVNVPNVSVAASAGSGVRYKPGHAPRHLERAAAQMVDSLRAAKRQGLEWVDPLAPRPGAPGVRALVVCGGRCVGSRDGVFVTERDFIVWLLVHNVTVCDMGAETSSLLSKTGMVVRRPAFNGCAFEQHSGGGGGDRGGGIGGGSGAGGGGGGGGDRGGSSAGDASAGRAGTSVSTGAAHALAFGARPGAAASASTTASGATRTARARTPSVAPKPPRAAGAAPRCPPEGGTYSAGDAGALGARTAVRHVALAFHGQFLHHRSAVKAVTQVLPAQWAAFLPAKGKVRPAHAGAAGPADVPADAPAPVEFDTFVATSSQHLELKPCDALDGPALCANLHNAGRFRYAECELRPYNGTAQIARAVQLGLPFRDAAKYSLFPHRVLSDYSTIARAMRLLRAHEARAGAQYDLVALSRIDIFFYFVRTVPPAAPPSWYARVHGARVVGRRRAHKPLWEDRFIIGRRAEMLSLERLADEFTPNFVQLGNQSYPEAQIWLHFKRVLGLGRHAPTAAPSFEAFLSIEGFRQNKKKFNKYFIEPPAALVPDPRFRRPRKPPH